MKKYRPSFTASQCKILLSLTSSLETEEGIKLHNYLDSFCYDIVKGYKKEAFTASHKFSIESSLGFQSSTESRREEAVSKYNSFPEACSKQEIEDAYNYKLVHGFSSKAEEEEMEFKLFGEI